MVAFCLSTGRVIGVEQVRSDITHRSEPEVSDGLRSARHQRGGCISRGVVRREVRFDARVDERYVLGGVMVGSGTMVLLLVAKVYPVDPGLARSIILPGIWVWFIIDSAGSIVAGASTNVVLSVGFLLAFVMPWRRASVPSHSKLR